uniref:Uncharacterized protein n=1 Tax=Rhizophora mucronata TaxID=61149 RepID=A0A2P2PW74_RHIMU
MHACTSMFMHKHIPGSSPGGGANNFGFLKKGKIFIYNLYEQK